MWLLLTLTSADWNLFWHFSRQRPFYDCQRAASQKAEHRNEGMWVIGKMAVGVRRGEPSGEREREREREREGGFSQWGNGATMSWPSSQVTLELLPIVVRLRLKKKEKCSHFCLSVSISLRLSFLLYPSLFSLALSLSLSLSLIRKHTF